MRTTNDLLIALTRDARLDVKVNGVALILEQRNNVIVVLREASDYGLDVIGLFNRLANLHDGVGFPVIFQERMYVASSCEKSADALADALRVASQYSL